MPSERGARSRSSHELVSILRQVRSPILSLPGCVTHGRTEKTVGPLFSEPPRAPENDRHLWITHGQPPQHVCRPRAASGLGAQEVGIVALDHDDRMARLGEPLHLEHEAAIRQRCRQVLQVVLHDAFG
jgi:hypothetical protein